MKRAQIFSKISDIIFIISGDLWAGAEVQVYHTLINLKKCSQITFNVIVFNDGLLTKKLTENGIPCWIIDESKNGILAMLYHLTKLLNKLKPKILHVHAYKEHILGQIASFFAYKHVEIIRTFHGMYLLPNEISLLKKIKSYIILKIENTFLRNCKIIAVSKDLENRLRKKYPHSFILHIYNGIPNPITNDISKKQIRKRYNIPDEVLWIGAVARLEKVKNLEMLIDVGELLKDKGIDFKISIFGTGSLQENLQQKIDNKNLQEVVKLEGFVSDIMPVLCSIDIFVLCSLHEGLPMSLLETMIAETAVICTSVGGINEIIENDYSGLLVPICDVPALCSSILRLNNDSILRKRLIINAKNKVIKEFMIENTNKKLVSLYKNLINS